MRKKEGDLEEEKREYDEALAQDVSEEEIEEIQDQIERIVRDLGEISQKVRDILTSPENEVLNTWDLVRMFEGEYPIGISYDEVQQAFDVTVVPDDFKARDLVLPLSTHIYDTGQKIYQSIDAMLREKGFSELPGTWDPKNTECLEIVQDLAWAEKNAFTPAKMRGFEIAWLLAQPQQTAIPIPLDKEALGALVENAYVVQLVRTYAKAPENIDRMLFTLFTEVAKDPSKSVSIQVSSTAAGPTIEIDRSPGPLALYPQDMKPLYEEFRNSPVVPRLMDTVVNGGRMEDLLVRTVTTYDPTRQTNEERFDTGTR